MRILVAGASGAIGRPLVRRLVSWGHEVAGLVRDDEGAALVVKEGATPLVADVLDGESVEQAVSSARPEVVIEELTALPRHYTPQAMRETFARTSNVRVVGGANVQRAALRAGATRFLAQSGCYFYGPGEGLADEAEPFVSNGPVVVAGNVASLEAVEQRLLGLPQGVTSLVLRYGFFYGPGTWFTRGGDMARQALSGQLAVLGPGTGVWSFVHVEDAADFTARAAVTSNGTGVVNVTDDTPLPMRAWVPAFAAYVGADTPGVVPITAETDADALYYATALRGASNRRAREAFGFRPRRLEWLGPRLEEQAHPPQG